MTTLHRAASEQSPLVMTVAGLSFQNPVLLAAGTAAFGRELAGVIELDSLGGIVTKAVSAQPREGASAPRVAEFPGGMINAVGLANPGLSVVRAEELPWLTRQVVHARVIVNVVGDTTDEFVEVAEGLADSRGVHALELNVSCPNVKAGGIEFGADPAALEDVVRRVRTVTTLPLFVKLSPALPDIARSARIAVDSGADAITLVNTLPGLVIDTERRRPVLGFGAGGVSGPGLLPVGVLATWKVKRAVSAPVAGVGGVASTEDALQYIIAGASLVAIGTAAMRDPRTPSRVIAGLLRWCELHGVVSLGDVVGSLEWPR